VLARLIVDGADIYEGFSPNFLEKSTGELFLEITPMTSRFGCVKNTLSRSCDFSVEVLKSPRSMERPYRIYCCGIPTAMWCSARQPKEHNDRRPECGGILCSPDEESNNKRQLIYPLKPKHCPTRANIGRLWRLMRGIACKYARARSISFGQKS